ncbi:hypothetical protein [Bradyrhizobium sp. WSM1253]|uniref:hypothetical protein n=1 Tax=Bradyrhizobium sp. WSM1253 TaxID=319003 RepID=UPI00025D3043|nr:hypothetical protein [Bradyrhizobium sp. WSM1253]EIG62807.1 hypothetical protein Bra1253DRAFT_07743 [Bradyrhizobium sp. WSM1253]
MRYIGDAGASDKHVWTPGTRPGTTLGADYSVKPYRSSFGGIPDSWSSKLYRAWKTGVAASGGLPKSSRGGVFLSNGTGKTKGLPLGFMARPKRTPALDPRMQQREEQRRQFSLALRQRGPDGRFIDTKRGSFEGDPYYVKKKTNKNGVRGGGEWRSLRFGDRRVQNRGVPMILLAYETKTHHTWTVHHEVVDRTRAMNKGFELSADGFEARYNRLMGH